MPFKPIKGKIYKHQIVFNESTGYWEFNGRRICGYLKDKKTGEVCKAYPKLNGRCPRHGGSDKQIAIRSNLPNSSTVKQIKLSDELKERVEQFKLNPDVFDLRNEIANVMAMIDILIDRLSEKNLYDYAALIGSLTKSVTEIKEKYYKIKSGYFDIYSVRAVIVQLIDIIDEFSTKARMLIDDERKLEAFDRYKTEVIDKIEHIKLPIIKE